MNKQRPVNLDLGAFRWPFPAYISIAHRISGVILFGAVAVLLCMLEQSLSSAQGFAELRETLQSPLCKLMVFAILAALIYHSVAGVKHLIMDFGVGESLEGGQRGALIVALSSLVLIALTGVWLW